MGWEVCSIGFFHVCWYSALTLSLPHWARGVLPRLSYDKIMWEGM